MGRQKTKKKHALLFLLLHYKLLISVCVQRGVKVHIVRSGHRDIAFIFIA